MIARYRPTLARLVLLLKYKKMINNMKFIFLVLTSVILFGCQSQTISYYSLPNDYPVRDTATIVGSEVKPSNIFYDKETTYIFAVDSVPVAGGREAHNQAVHITKGQHTIQVANRQGQLLANVAFLVDVSGGEQLVARGRVLNDQNVELWIETNNGHKVTQILIGPRIAGGITVIPIFL